MPLLRSMPACQHVPSRPYLLALSHPNPYPYPYP